MYNILELVISVILVIGCWIGILYIFYKRGQGLERYNIIINYIRDKKRGNIK